MHAAPETPEIVDAHVHLWDLGLHPAWYPGIVGQPKPGEDGGLDAGAGLRRNYLLPEYGVDTARYRVSGLVHVSATQGIGSYVGETHWVDGLLAGQQQPYTLIGAIEPEQPLAAIEAELDALQRCPRLRGVRVMFGLDPSRPATRDFLRLLDERGLIFDLVTHPHNAIDFARLLDTLPGLQLVLEHTGWPTQPGAPGHFGEWQSGMRALAARERIDCKLSGLPMSLHAIDASAMRPWIESAIDIFGVPRCCFASNFPVDGLYGSFDDLYGAYREITRTLGHAEQHALFAGNARRIYTL